jgi:magnesium transporter
VGRVLGREVLIGLLLGFLYGAALGVFGFIKYYEPAYMNAILLGTVISVSLCLGMTLAAFVATAMPFLLHRFHLDPAAATGPFVTTFCDITGIAVYLSLATFVLL